MIFFQQTGDKSAVLKLLRQMGFRAVEDVAYKPFYVALSVKHFFEVGQHQKEGRGKE